MKITQLLAKIGGSTLFTLISLTGFSAHAAIDFNFSFDNTMETSDTVSGSIFSLEDIISEQQAISILIASIPLDSRNNFNEEDGVNWIPIGNDLFFKINTMNIDDDTFTFGAFGSNYTPVENVTINVSSNNLEEMPFEENDTASVPFEFSPALGLFVVGSLWGTKLITKRLKANSSAIVNNIITD